jgi:hypothetical protein
LWLPSGTIRLLTVGGTIAVLVWLTVNDRDHLIERLTPDPSLVKHWATFLLAGFVGLVAGFLLRSFRYIHSWIAVVALIAMLAEIVIEVFILPTIKDQNDMVVWRSTVTAIAAAYFGTRS